MPIFSVEEEGNTRTEKMNVPFDLFCVAMFTVPLLMAVPEWYVTVEIVTVVILFVFMAIATVGMYFALSAASAFGKSLLEEVEDEINEERRAKNFITRKTLVGWAFHAFMLGSMFMQDMVILFSIYLIMHIILNVMRHMLLKKGLDIRPQLRE